MPETPLGITYPAPGDPPDGPAAFQTMALDVDALIRGTPVNPQLLGAPLVEVVPYTGQRTRWAGQVANVTTNAGGYALLIAASSISGGVLSGTVHGVAAFPIVAAFNTSGGSLGVTLWNGVTLAAGTSIAIAYAALIYDA